MSIKRVNLVREHSSLTTTDGGIEPSSLRNDLYHRQKSVAFSNGVNRNFGLIIFAIVALFGLTLTPTAGNAGPDEGKGIVVKENCAGCHNFEGPVEKLPIGERANIKGPDLWFAGSKLKKESLLAWLKKPEQIFGVKFGTLEIGVNEHKPLPPQDAADVTAYLMTLKDQGMATGVIPTKKMKKRKKMLTKKLFENKQKCFFCHQILRGGVPVGGFSGPSLIGAKDRLNGDWVYSFLKNPHRYYPNGKMPIYGDKATNLFSDDDLKTIAEYVVNLKK